jgi:hypothetical protein
VVFALVEQSERLDWNFVVQKSIVLGAWTIAFVLFFRMSAVVGEPAAMPGRSIGQLIMLPPIVAVAALWGVPRGAALLADERGAPLDVAEILERQAARDIGVRLEASAFVRQPGTDGGLYRALLEAAAANDAANASSDRAIAPVARAAGNPPHIFLFVIDSLRPDYLLPYNGRADFTPEIDRFARDGFVFSNAFTRYGGTWLSMPSLWAGGEVPRSWGGKSVPFHRLNAIETLLAANGYRVAINDYTVAASLQPTTPVTFLDPEVRSRGRQRRHGSVPSGTPARGAHGHDRGRCAAAVRVPRADERAPAEYPSR